MNLIEYKQKKDLLDWFDNFLKNRIANLGMWDDEIKLIYKQAIVDNSKIRKELKINLAQAS